MNLITDKTDKLNGIINIPGSKSHTIRAVVFASMAEGISKIYFPLDSFDTKACVNACTAFGALIKQNQDSWEIHGVHGNIKNPNKVLDMLNSGTSMNIMTGISSLGNFEVVLDGDDSLRSRPMQALLESLIDLGVNAYSINNNGKPPLKIKGPYKGGKTRINGINSQYVTSLLITASLANYDTEILVENIHEIPYIRMTLNWLDEQGIRYEKKDDLTGFKVYGNQSFKSFEKHIPSDWSSASFPICAGLVTDSDILVKGPDINDVQGDKKIIDVLKSMGANISIEENGIRIKKSTLTGRTIDLNSMPDALPIMSVIGCIAKGETIITNVAQARIKETDRIKVMTIELKKMGANIEELPDGIKIKKSRLIGTNLKGYSDHRIVMALSIAGLFSEGKVVIDTAESVGVTFPGYVEKMKALGANYNLV